MSSNPVGSSLAATPVVDPRTGLMNRDWYRTIIAAVTGSSGSGPDFQVLDADVTFTNNTTPADIFVVDVPANAVMSVECVLILGDAMTTTGLGLIVSTTTGNLRASFMNPAGNGSVNVTNSGLGGSAGSGYLPAAYNNNWTQHHSQIWVAAGAADGQLHIQVAQQVSSASPLVVRAGSRVVAYTG